MSQKNTDKRGFASMDEDKQREIASKSGKQQKHRCRQSFGIINVVRLFLGVK